MLKVNPLKPLLKKIPTPLQNRYVMTSVIFAAWMLFFDKHGLYTQWKLSRTSSKMVQDKAYYQQKIEEVKQDRIDMDANKEKFAREHYYMSREGEEVFIIKDRE